MTRRGHIIAVVVAIAATTSASAVAADAAAGKTRAAACAACHGQDGIATAPDAPNLAGQPEDYLAAQLKAYRGGTRKHEVMSLMAKPLSDADIANLSAWFASQRIALKP